MIHNFRQPLSWILIPLIVVAISTPLLFAQSGKGKQGGFDPSKLKDTIYEGRVVGVAPGLPGKIMCLNADNQRAIVYVDPRQTMVNVRGVAETSALKSQMFIRFTGTVDETGALTEPIKNMEIYTPSPSDPQNDLTAGTEQIIEGKLLRYADDELQLLANGRGIKKVTGTLDPTVEITVHFTDYKMAQKESNITVRGKEYQQIHILAQDVEIELIQPLSGRR
ncbi:Hypothetical protein PBC10988_2230 [Planctomycetales bacterium 10988]|nr:Hypothetical protein PBC10988_2230 [Planctomycetales bacterium 10988]